METGNDKAAGARSAPLVSLLQGIDRKHHALPNAVPRAGGLPHRTNRQIELIPLAKLTASKTNARAHSAKQLRQIAASVERFGFTVPVLVNAQNQILAGHGRVEAAKLLGLEEVPALRVNHLSPVEQRAFAIADNRLAELAGWDREALAIELKALIELDFDIEVTGFEISEIALVADGDDEARKESGRATSKATKDDRAVSRCGDAWLLGAHQLNCGDSADEDGYAAIDTAIRRWQTFTGESAKLVGSGQTFNKVERERRKAAHARPAAAEPRPEAV